MQLQIAIAVRLKLQMSIIGGSRPICSRPIAITIVRLQLPNCNCNCSCVLPVYPRLARAAFGVMRDGCRNITDLY